MGRTNFYTAADDAPQFIVRRDISGGVNNRQYDQILAENQCTVLNNVSLDTAGQREIRSGITLIEDIGTTTGTGAFGFEPEGGTNELLVTHGTKLEGYVGSGTFTEHKTDFTTGLLTTMVKAIESDEGDVVIVSNGTDNCYRMTQAHAFQDLGDTNYSPPKTTVMTFFRDRLWALDAEKLYYSGAIPSDYSGILLFNHSGMVGTVAVGDTVTGATSTASGTVTAITSTTIKIMVSSGTFTTEQIRKDVGNFVTSTNSGTSESFNRSLNYYSIPIGTARALAGTRDYGLIVFGSAQIYQVNPSIVPDPAADKTEKVLDIGCAASNTVAQVGDDVFFLAYDGVRALFRTVQDKLQSGESYPLSWNLKTEYEEINWAHIHKACAVFWNNKYIISLPTGSATYNNKMWVYYPAYKGWVVFTGMSIASMAVVKIGNEERLYGMDATDAKCYRMFYGTSDNGTAIAYTEEGRGEDFGAPLQRKYGGEFKLKVVGQGVTVTPYANVDNAGYVALTGSALVLAPGGLDFTFDFPFSFGSYEESGVWHLDNLGYYKIIKFKIYSGTLDATLKVLESVATTFKEEYLSED